MTSRDDLFLELTLYVAFDRQRYLRYFNTTRDVSVWWRLVSL